MESEEMLHEKELEQVSGGTGPRGFVGDCSYTCPFCGGIHYFHTFPDVDEWRITEQWDICESVLISRVRIAGLNIPTGGTLAVDYDFTGKIVSIPFLFM